MPERFGEQFLHQQDQKLHITEPVEHEQRRKKSAGGESSQKPAEKIADFLSVIEKTHLGHRENPEVLERIKRHYHQKHVIGAGSIPEAYWDSQRQIIIDEGRSGDFEKDTGGKIVIPEEVKSQMIEVLQSDQRSSLDNWIDYLASPDADVYPIWAKYWAFKGMLKLSSYDKERHAFGRRDKGTVAPYPDLDREALAYAIDAIVKKAGKQHIPEEQDNPEFKKLLQGANFGKLYVYAAEKVAPAPENELQNTKGEWVRYEKGSDPMPLVESLQGRGTGWCTAGESTAKAQLGMGDFWVYYSYDRQGRATIPRSAIRMQGDTIAEVRGIAAEQNLDPYIGGIVAEKLNEFPDGKHYQKKVEDMRSITAIWEKTKSNQELSRPELVFLYEIENPIEGFGYQKDPRIQEIREQRNPKEDAPIVLGLKSEEISWNQTELSETTKAYIGPLFKEIWDLPLEAIYTKFPEKPVKRFNLVEIGGQTVEQLEQELHAKNINISAYALDMLGKMAVQKEKTAERFVRLAVGDLGFSNGATTQQVYERAGQLNLELCPPETGPRLRLQYENQPMDEWVRIGMEPIAVRYGYPDVFDLARDADGLWLYVDWADPKDQWHAGDEFVFRLRKSKPLST